MFDFMAVANYENKTFLKECDYETKQYWTRYEIQIFFGIWFMNCDIKARHVRGHFNGSDDHLIIPTLPTQVYTCICPTLPYWNVRNSLHFIEPILDDYGKPMLYGLRKVDAWKLRTKWQLPREARSKRWQRITRELPREVRLISCNKSNARQLEEIDRDVITKRGKKQEASDVKE